MSKFGGSIWGEKPKKKSTTEKKMLCPKCKKNMILMKKVFYEGLLYCYECDTYYTENLREV